MGGGWWVSAIQARIQGVWLLVAGMALLPFYRGFIAVNSQSGMHTFSWYSHWVSSPSLSGLIQVWSVLGASWSNDHTTACSWSGMSTCHLLWGCPSLSEARPDWPGIHSTGRNASQCHQRPTVVSHSHQPQYYACWMTYTNLVMLYIFYSWVYIMTTLHTALTKLGWGRLPGNLRLLVLEWMLSAHV